MSQLNFNHNILIDSRHKMKFLGKFSNPQEYEYTSLMPNLEKQKDSIYRKLVPILPGIIGVPNHGINKKL